MESASSLESAANALVEAVGILRTQTATGSLLGVGQAAISKRIAKGQPAAAEWVLPLERATGISRHRLRPDLYPLQEPAHSPDLAQVNVQSPNDRAAGLQLGAAVR